MVILRSRNEEINYNGRYKNVKLAFLCKSTSKQRIKNYDNGIFFMDQVSKDKNMIILNVSENMIKQTLTHLRLKVIL